MKKKIIVTILLIFLIIIGSILFVNIKNHKIEEQNKTGSLYIKENLNERLILITCSKNNSKTQMIYYSNLKSISDI